jgi:hypothetical protein
MFPMTELRPILMRLWSRYFGLRDGGASACRACRSETPVMNELSQFSQFIIVAGFGVICFACGYLIAFIVVRNPRRDEMIKRGVARYNWRTGNWEWGEPPKDRS